MKMLFDKLGSVDMNVQELLEMFRTRPRAWASILNVPLEDVEGWVLTNKFPPEIEQRIALIENLLVENNLLGVKLYFTVRDMEFQKSLWVNEWDPQSILASIQKYVKLQEDLNSDLKELAKGSDQEDQERNWGFSSTYLTKP